MSFQSHVEQYNHHHAPHFYQGAALPRLQGGNSAAVCFPLNFIAHYSSAPPLQQENAFSYIPLPNIKSNKNSDDPQLWFTTSAMGPTTDVVLRCKWCDQGTQMTNYTMHPNGLCS